MLIVGLPLAHVARAPPPAAVALDLVLDLELELELELGSCLGLTQLIL